MIKNKSSVFEDANSIPVIRNANEAPGYRCATGVVDFSHEAIRYPLGFPVRILSNSSAVIHAAGQSWNCFHRMFEHDPLEVRVIARRESQTTGTIPPAPTNMLKDDLLINFADAENYSVSDLTRGCTVCRVTEAALASPLYFRYHLLEASVLSMINALRAVAVHAACVISRNKGFLLCGDSGAGKSTLAYAGARAGWTYVSDDASYALLGGEGSVVVGNCHQIRFRPSAAELFPEIAEHSVTPRATGKPSVEIRTIQWPNMRTTSVAAVDYILLLNRNRHSHQELVALPPSEVLRWLTQQVQSTSGSRAPQEAALSRLLKSGVFELRYHDLDWAIERINRLAEDGR